MTSAWHKQLQIYRSSLSWLLQSIKLYTTIQVVPDNTNILVQSIQWRVIAFLNEVQSLMGSFYCPKFTMSQSSLIINLRGLNFDNITQLVFILTKDIPISRNHRKQTVLNEKKNKTKNVENDTRLTAGC